MENKKMITVEEDYLKNLFLIFVTTFFFVGAAVGLIVGVQLSKRTYEEIKQEVIKHKLYEIK